MEYFIKKIRTMFVLLQIVLYVAFLTLDLTGKSMMLSIILKFTVIILCFCYALLPIKSTDKSILFFVRVGLLFTVVSDLFLLILDKYFYGVLTFVIVQQLYGLMIDKVIVNNSTVRQTSRYNRFFTRLLYQIGITIFIILLLQGVGVVRDMLLITSTFYFICILTNTLRAMKTAVANKTTFQKKVEGIQLFAYGMVLFLLCDINVGLFNLSGFVALPTKLYDIIYGFSSVLMWTFYAPSQVLIALSSHKIR